jgi:hypothetical protein
MLYNAQPAAMAEMDAEPLDVEAELAELAREPFDQSAEMADLDTGVESIGQALLTNMEQLILQQQQQIEMLGALAQQIQMAMLAPRRIVRDDKGRVIGSQVEV